MNSYALLHRRKDKLRLVKALRDEANRLERDAEVLKVEFQAAPKTMGVTDHAMVRFLERVAGVNMEAIREQIARLIPPGALPVDHASEQRVILVEGHQFVVSPTCIITIVTEDMGPFAGRALPRREEFLLSA